MGVRAGKEELKIRLCVVSPLYHPSLGGLGRQAQLLTEALADWGVKVIVIARYMTAIPKAVFSRKVCVYRAWSLMPNIHNFERVSLRNVIISFTFSISCAVLLIVNRKKFDVVHFHGSSLPLFANIFLLKIMGKKVIAKVAAAGVGTEAGSLKGRYFGMGNLIIKELRMVDAFVATTSEIKNGLLRDGFLEERIHQITNFIDLSIFSPATTGEKRKLRTHLGLGNYPTVLFSGRFIWRKGVDFLLEAWRDVARLFPEARLLFLGDGPLLYEMRKKALLFEIGQTIQFQGHVNEIADFLQSSDIFVLSSLQEGMPNSLLEAMACGLPPVATRIGGVVDIIRDGDNGVLVEAGNSKALAEGIEKLLMDRRLANNIAGNAYRTIRDTYSLGYIVPRYIELYRKTIE